MRFYRTAILAAAMAIAFSSLASATGYYPPVYVPPVRPAPPVHGGGGGGSNWHLCPTPAGIFICAVTVAIVVHELRGPACASKSKYNVARGYDQPTFWRPLCRFKREPAVKPIRVRG